MLFLKDRIIEIKQVTNSMYLHVMEVAFEGCLHMH